MSIHYTRAQEARIGLPVVADLILLKEASEVYQENALKHFSFLAHRHKPERLLSEDEVNYYLVDFCLSDTDKAPELDRPIWVYACIRGFYYPDGPFPEKIRQSLEVVAWSYRREEIVEAYDSDLMDKVLNVLTAEVRKGSGSNFGIAGLPILTKLESPKPEVGKPEANVAPDGYDPYGENPDPPVQEPKDNIFNPNEDDGIPFDQGPGWATDMED